jgi:rubrerythrin
MDTTRRIIEELAIAYKTELTGYAYYTYAADLVKDERGKNVFRHIAKEELQHMAVVSFIGDALEEGLGLAGYEAALKSGRTALEKKGIPIFSEKNELIEGLKKNPTDQNAVRIAMEAEEKAVAFYSNMLRHAATPQEETLFTKLLEMEKGHLELFRWEEDSLLKRGFWCDMMEFTLEAEKE